MKPAPTYTYHDSYDDAHGDTKSLAGYMMDQGYALLERILPPNYTCEKVLEIGTGTGRHFPHITHPFDTYCMSDYDPKMLEICARKYEPQIASGKIILDKQSALSLTYPDNSFDRLIATHVLEHLPNPVQVLAEWNRVVKTGGLISILLPCDPGMLWRLGRMMGPRRQAIASGKPYDYLMASEHVNAIFNLVTFIRYHFPNVREGWYPARLPLPDIKLFYACHITKE